MDGRRTENLQENDPLSVHLKGLFSQATGNTLVPGSIAKEIREKPLTLHTPDSKSPYEAQEENTLRLIFNLGTEHAGMDKAVGIKALQDALGSVPLFAKMFNGFKPLPPIGKHFDALLAANPAQGGLTPEDLKVIGEWKDKALDPYSWHTVGPQVSSGSDTAVSISYSAVDAAEADKIRASLKERSAAILATVKDMAMSSDALMPEQKQQLAALQIEVSEHNSQFGNNVSLTIGVPNVQATEKKPDGSLPLTASVLNVLMEKHVNGNELSVGETTLRYAALYAPENEPAKWHETFPLLAGSYEVKHLLQDRVAKAKNEALGSAVNAFLDHDVFMTRAQQEEKWKHRGANFRLRVPDEKHPTSYRITMLPPDGVTQKDLTDAILATPLKAQTAQAAPVPANDGTAHAPQTTGPVTPQRPILGDATRKVVDPKAANSNLAAPANDEHGAGVPDTKPHTVVGDATKKIHDQKAANANNTALSA